MVCNCVSMKLFQFKCCLIKPFTFQLWHLKILEAIVLIPMATKSWTNWNSWPFLYIWRCVCGDNFIPKSGESDTSGEVKSIYPAELESKGEVSWQKHLNNNCGPLLEAECGLLWEPGTLGPTELKGCTFYREFLEGTPPDLRGGGKSILWNTPRLLSITKASSPGEGGLQKLCLCCEGHVPPPGIRGLKGSLEWAPRMRGGTKDGKLHHWTIAIGDRPPGHESPVCWRLNQG